MTNLELSARTGLTPAPCLRRVRRLEAEGIIAGYVAVVDETQLGRGFAQARAAVEAFEQRVAGMDEVVELRRMFGLPDYLIRVRAADPAAYEKWLMAHLLGDPAIARVDSRITMKVVKSKP